MLLVLQYKMRITVLFLVVCLCCIALGAPRNTQRIVGGTATDIREWPFVAALLYKHGNSFTQACGGTILTTTAILSAAHCIDGEFVSSWRVRVGSTNSNSGGAVHMFGTFSYPNNYNRKTYDNDISVLRTTTSFVWDGNVQPASIAGTNYQLGDNKIVWAVGWGSVSYEGPTSKQLRKVYIWTINQAICRSRYAELSLNVTDNMLCSGHLDVGGRDQCQGDSGGLLIRDNVVVGVCSWGHQCASPRYPGVNTRVSNYAAWIQRATSL